MKEIKILIAEDYLDNFLLLKVLLKELPCIITHAIDGEEALRIIQKESFDLYLIDIHMPNIDGYEFIKRIRQNNNLTPAIAQTASAFSADAEKCLNSGFNEYIAKPIDKDLLIQKVRKLLNQPQ